MRILVIAAFACLALSAPAAEAEPFGGCTFDTSGLGLGVAFATVDAACGTPDGALCAVAVMGDCVAP